MAIAPLFVPDLDTLKARLRLSAVDTGDASAVVNSAVEEVRLHLYEELGEDLVTDLVALPRVENPTTDDGLRRLRAENIELLWVRMLLMQRLPTFYAQSFGQTRKAWNEEGITREARGSEYKRDLTNLLNEIRDALAHLTGDETGELLAAVLLPDVLPPKPGESVFGATIASGLVPIVFQTGVPIVTKLATFIDTFTDSGQSAVAKGDPDTGGPALNVAMHRTAVNRVYIHLEFDLSGFASIDDANLYFHKGDQPSNEAHNWEMYRMIPQVIEVQSSHNNIDQGAGTPWPTGGADGGLADALLATVPTPLTGVVPADLAIDSQYKFANLRLFALDAIANRNGRLSLFIRQEPGNTTTLLNFHSSRANSILEPKLWVVHTA